MLKETLGWSVGAPTAIVAGAVSIDRFSTVSGFVQKDILSHFIDNKDIVSGTGNLLTLVMLAVGTIALTGFAARGAYKLGEAGENLVGGNRRNR